MTAYEWFQVWVLMVLAIRATRRYDKLKHDLFDAIKGKTAWVLQAQFGHLFGDEKDIPPGPFEIIGIKYKPSILTSLKKLLGFLN